MSVGRSVVIPVLDRFALPICNDHAGIVSVRDQEACTPTLQRSDIMMSDFPCHYVAGTSLETRTQIWFRHTNGSEAAKCPIHKTLQIKHNIVQLLVPWIAATGIAT